MLTIKKDFPLEQEVLEVLRYIQDVTKKIEVSYLMIGGRAIDLLLHNVYGLPTYRPTEDIDFIIAFESWEEFDYLKNQLIKTGEFKNDKKKCQRLIYKEKMPIDLLPFGRLEKPYRSISWPSDDDLVMNVQGFQDINTAAEKINFVKNEMVIRIASIPGLVVLKLFAWSDRAESKDAQDIFILLHKYNQILDNKRLYEDIELLGTSAHDVEKVGATLLGRDARLILSLKNTNIVKEILNKKERLLNAIAGGLSMVDIEEKFATVEKLFEAFCKGFLETK